VLVSSIALSQAALRATKPSSHLVNASSRTASAGAAGAATDEWPSYNRALQSDRFAKIDQIDTTNVAQLRKLCEYDTGVATAFESGLIEAGGLLYGTTDTDTFAIDPSNCHEVWRAHEVNTQPIILKVNRGAVFFKGRVVARLGRVDLARPDGQDVVGATVGGSCHFKIRKSRIVVPSLKRVTYPTAFRGEVFRGRGDTLWITLPHRPVVLCDAVVVHRNLH